MKGLDPTERSVMDVLAAFAAGHPCRKDSCGGVAGEFPPGQIDSVWRMVARGLASTSQCGSVPGLMHISITKTGLLMLNIANTALPPEK